jgi:hypothetical protein
MMCTASSGQNLGKLICDKQLDFHQLVGDMNSIRSMTEGENYHSELCGVPPKCADELNETVWYEFIHTESNSK